MIEDFPPHPADTTDDGINVLAEIKRAWDRLVAVAANKAEKAELKRIEFDLLEPAFIDAAANHPDQRAVIVAVAQLQTHSFTKSAKEIEKQIVKRRTVLAREQEAQRVADEQRQHAAFKVAAAKAESNEAWPPTRKGPHPIVEASLSRTKMGARPSFANVYKAIRDDPRYGPRLSVNRLGEVVEKDGKPITSETVEAAEATEWLADTYGLHVAPDTTLAAIFAVAETHAHHPVKDYLDSLPEWDGTQTISRILTDVLGIAPPTSIATEEGREEQAQYDLYQLYIRRHAISSVARIYRPGCKQDTALVLVGNQGAQKSSVLKWWHGPEFFVDSPIQIGSKDGPILLRAAWCFEFAEGASLTRKTADEIKQFMTIDADTFRHVYEKNARRWPRHTVCTMTVNKPQFLNDETGSRRWWPILIPPTVRINLRLMKQLRDAAWSEAVAAYKKAEAAFARDETPGPDCRWWFEPDEDLIRSNDAGRFTIGDVWDPFVIAWLDKRAAEFTVSDILTGAIELSKERMTAAEESRMRRILSRLGYRSKRKRKLDGYVDVWVKDAGVVMVEAGPPSPLPAAPPPLPPKTEQALPDEDEDPPWPDEPYVPTDDDGNIY